MPGTFNIPQVTVHGRAFLFWRLLRQTHPPDRDTRGSFNYGILESKFYQRKADGEAKQGEEYFSNLASYEVFLRAMSRYAYLVAELRTSKHRALYSTV